VFFLLSVVFLRCLEVVFLCHQLKGEKEVSLPSMSKGEKRVHVVAEFPSCIK
jgi:hypothetical protein